MLTTSQRESIRTAAKQLIDLGDEKTAATLAWIDDAPSPQAEPRLTREARIGHTSFGIGVPERFVIEAAQRAAEHPQGEVDKAAAAELQRLIQESAERAAFLDAHPAVTAELASLIAENERLSDLVSQCALGYVVDWQAAAQQLVERAEAAGWILTVERVAVEPLAMGKHRARVTSYRKR